MQREENLKTVRKRKWGAGKYLITRRFSLLLLGESRVVEISSMLISSYRPLQPPMSLSRQFSIKCYPSQALPSMAINEKCKNSFAREINSMPQIYPEKIKHKIRKVGV